MSNRSLAEVIRNFLGAGEVEINEPRRRPDFVALPDSSIGAYSADNYDNDGEALGLRKVLLVELKKGGFNINQKEVDQARNYAIELQDKGKVEKTTQIVAYVLGDTLAPNVAKSTHGEFITVYPVVYDAILRRAEARTFNLHKKLKDYPPVDSEVAVVLQDDPQLSFAEVGGRGVGATNGQTFAGESGDSHLRPFATDFSLTRGRARLKWPLSRTRIVCAVPLDQ